MPSGSVLLAAFALAVAACAASPGGAPTTSPPAPSASTPGGVGSEPLDAEAPGSESDARPAQDRVQPVLSTARSGDGATGTLTFRSTDGVGISAEAPLRLRLEGRLFEAPLRSGPARFAESDSVVVDQATYRLSSKAYFTLVGTPPAEAVVEVHDGTAYVAYPYVSGDLIE